VIWKGPPRNSHAIDSIGYTNHEEIILLVRDCLRFVVNKQCQSRSSEKWCALHQCCYDNRPSAVRLWWANYIVQRHKSKDVRQQLQSHERLRLVQHQWFSQFKCRRLSVVRPSASVCDSDESMQPLRCKYMNDCRLVITCSASLRLSQSVTYRNSGTLPTTYICEPELNVSR